MTDVGGFNAKQDAGYGIETTLYRTRVKRLLQDESYRKRSERNFSISVGIIQSQIITIHVDSILDYPSMDMCVGVAFLSLL